MLFFFCFRFYHSYGVVRNIGGRGEGVFFLLKSVWKNVNGGGVGSLLSYVVESSQEA